MNCDCFCIRDRLPGGWFCSEGGPLDQVNKKYSEPTQNENDDGKQSENAGVHPLGKRRIGFPEAGGAGERRVR
jgi:hypothetical protein